MIRFEVKLNSIKGEFSQNESGFNDLVAAVRKVDFQSAYNVYFNAKTRDIGIIDNNKSLKVDEDVLSEIKSAFERIKNLPESTRVNQRILKSDFASGTNSYKDRVFLSYSFNNSFSIIRGLAPTTSHAFSGMVIMLIYFDDISAYSKDDMPGTEALSDHWVIYMLPGSF